MQSPRRPSAGFTLVEMLVVIAIIGVLAAIGIPAIYGALIRARQAAIAADIAQLEMSVEAYKNKYGDYPPNFLELYTTAHTAGSPDQAWATTILARHLKRINRQAKSAGAAAGVDLRHPLNVVDPKDNSLFLLKDPPSSTAITSDPAAMVSYIDPAEALVLWLGGLSANPQYPLTGAGGPLTIDTSTMMFLHPDLRRETAIHEFKADRLKDYDGDGLYEYYPPSGSRVPYAYFDSRFYDNGWAEFSMAQVPGKVRPYVTTAAAGALAYANPQKFQIMCAGLDENYGDGFSRTVSNPPVDRKMYPTGAAIPASNVSAYAREDLDNLSNFSTGIFEDKLP